MGPCGPIWALMGPPGQVLAGPDTSDFGLLVEFRTFRVQELYFDGISKWFCIIFASKITLFWPKTLIFDQQFQKIPKNMLKFKFWGWPCGQLPGHPKDIGQLCLPHGKIRLTGEIHAPLSHRHRIWKWKVDSIWGIIILISRRTLRKTYFYIFVGIFRAILIKYLSFWSK